ncbi:hypothetical protein [Caulobacter sp. RHG1]|uniref:hypothetical protein n=1 Tax=Caulobacter sp. (strain RHG1) TaxID=2545762 RepID=UPI00155246CA|nr:hypothetical protein [Caulobacter sp. RHG1]NQE63370.1 hypothetical protein [Caulobacter sp. RHG1]
MKIILSTLLMVGALAAAGGALAQKAPGAPLSETSLTIDPNFGQKILNAESAGIGYRESGNPLVVTKAGQLLAETGVTCDVKDAALITDSRKGTTYEVACRDDFGWMVNKTPAGLTAYDCIAIQASAKGAPKGLGKGTMATCRLRANVGNMAGPQALVKKVGAKCTVSDATYLGGGGAPPIARYEVACKEGGGFVIDKPQPKSQARLLAAACSADPNSRLPCTLHDKKS